MTWNWKTASLWQRLLVALLIVGAASAFRAVFFGTLGRGIPYLVFYPAVMLAALYSGLAGGLLATALSVPLSFFWVQRSYLSPPEWLGMLVFVLSCLTVSAIGEAMRRAQKQAEAANQELQREIAEHKQAEEKIDALNAELEQRVRDRTAQLEAANQELEAFSYSVSHDLRAPLRAIDGYGRILVEDHNDRLDPEGRRVLGVISSETQRMGRLIDELLAFSRLGRQPLKHEAMLPLTLVNLARAELQAAQAAVAAAAKPPRGNETVLFVEDEKSIRITTRLILEDLGYTVLVADAPAQALSQAAAHSGEIHLLITDVVMPGMSGRDLAKRLSELRPSIKRLFISGFTRDVIAQRGILDDGVHFLSKPFGRDALAWKVREVLEGGWMSV